MKDRMIDVLEAIYEVIKILVVGLVFMILMGVALAFSPVLIIVYIVTGFNFLKWVDDEIIDLI